MKKFIILSAFCFLLSAFAAMDTDSDGIADDKDLCPRVYSRSETGCPVLTAVASLPSLNACYRKQSSTMIVRVQPICDTVTKVCPTLSSVSGVQACDILFPLIMKDGQPFVR